VAFANTITRMVCLLSVEPAPFGVSSIRRTSLLENDILQMLLPFEA